MKYSELPLGPFSCVSHPHWIWVKTPTGYFDTEDWSFAPVNGKKSKGFADYFPITLKVNTRRKTATPTKK